MIKLIETFDHVSAPGGVINTLYAIPPFEVGSDFSLLTQLGWTFPTMYYGMPYIAPAAGRLGSSALVCPGIIGFTPTIRPPRIGRKCSRLVLGMAIMPTGPATKSFVVYFQYDDHINFSIKCLVNSDGSLTVSMCTGSTGTGYPAITIPATPIPAPYITFDYTFVEVYVDVADYANGRAKVAVNGKTYVDKTGIITAAYNAFGDNPYDDRAKLNNVCVTMLPPGGYNSQTYYFDTIYLCDDEGGFQDDFLGPVFSKSFYPVAAGSKSNWSPYVNSTYHEDGKHYELVDDDPVQPGNELSYLEADQDLTEEMFVFPPDPLPVGSTLVSVNHRTMFRNVASPGMPPSNALIPLYQIAGNPVVATNSLAKKITGWLYEGLDVYYNIVPGLAIPWTEYLLGQSEFGFLMREAIWTGVLDEPLEFADEVIDE